MNKPKLMIIDSPFEGLDQKSRTFLRKRLISLLNRQQCLLLLNEDDPIINHFDSVSCLDNGKLLLQDSPETVKQSCEWQQLFTPHRPILEIPPKHHSFIQEAQENIALNRDGRCFSHLWGCESSE